MHRSVRGLIICNWNHQGDRVVLDLQVPVNSSAALVLPTSGTLTEKGHPATDSIGVKKIVGPERHPAFRLASGKYHFVFAPSNELFCTFKHAADADLRIVPQSERVMLDFSSRRQ